MTKKQQEQFEKFKKFTRWMYEDAKEAMFCARANFLVAMGLFNYIEILGTFLIGYFQKDKSGQVLKDTKGREIKTKLQNRFNTFFSYLGQEYKNLIDAHPEVYDELRCGLTHEYLPRKRSFCVYGINTRLTEEQMDNLRNNIDGSRVTCGVIFLFLSQNSIWQIFTPKFLIDFERGARKLIKEIEDEKDKKLMAIFFEAADQINLENFG